MFTYNRICQNPHCNKKYMLEEGEVDDGYCSFECWEKVNCQNPEEKGDILDTHVEEIINNRN